MRIALISCTKDKKDYPCPAYELYSASHLFCLSYQYAKSFADKIYILSAKHGLVAENQLLAPYNQTLKDMTRSQQLQWAEAVLQRLRQECDPERDQFVFLAGSTYSRDLVGHLSHCELPLEGMRLGDRMAHLKKLLAEPLPSMALRLHRLFGAMTRYNWQQIREIPFENGIYILFERGETYGGMERIVRVGTHTAPNRLRPRLTDHFVRENHDGSIFRKNIGKAILKAYHDPYLEIWSLDTSKPENRPRLDPSKNADTEGRVSKYLRENFTFTVFRVEDKAERLRMEEAIIAALNSQPDFGPGRRWAGRFSPEREIRESGLWLKQGLDGQPLTEGEYRRLLTLCAGAPAPQKPAAPVPAPNSRGRRSYEPLYEYLRHQGSDWVVLTMEQVEGILGAPLPKSARQYPEWYNPSGHSHCRCWLRAGYEVADPATAIKTGKITFVRRKGADQP